MVVKRKDRVKLSRSAAPIPSLVFGKRHADEWPSSMSSMRRRLRPRSPDLRYHDIVEGLVEANDIGIAGRDERHPQSLAEPEFRP